VSHLDKVAEYKREAEMEPRPRGPGFVGAIVCFVLAAGLAIVSVLFVVQAVGEYGPSEGARTIAGQTLPLAIAGLVVAAVLAWLGTRLLRRSR
jgi:Na+/proline symporter